MPYGSGLGHHQHHLIARSHSSGSEAAVASVDTYLITPWVAIPYLVIIGPASTGCSGCRLHGEASVR